jgi:CRP-like cAMP-binding protein
MYTPTETKLIAEAVAAGKIPIKQVSPCREGIEISDSLQRLSEYGFTVKRAPGTILLTEGDKGKEMYLILDGEVSVTIAGFEVAKIGAGQFFGEMSMIDGLPRSATITAITECTLLVIDPKNFETIIQAEPKVAIVLLETVIKRFRVQNEILSKSIWQVCQ